MTIPPRFWIALSSTLLLGVATVYFYLGQGSANADLEAVNANLDSVSATLQQTTATLAQEKATNAALRSGEEVLKAQLAKSSADHANLEAALDSLSREHVDLGADHNSLLADYDLVIQQYEGLKEDRDNLQGRYEQLVRSVGNIQTPEGQIQALEPAIADLEERRRPLLLSPGYTVEDYYSCTGSMEPALTCLDSTVSLRDFKPGDIIVGATITFAPPCWEKDNNRAVTHRVMEIKEIDGELHYWPKGDANRSPDGCWIPHSSVQSYVIEILRNVYPKNARLREAVNESRQTYYEHLDRYCGVGVATSDCTVTTTQHATLVLLYAKYQCWQDNAKASRRPGHIPFQCH